MHETTPSVEQGLTTADRGHEDCRDGPEACRESPDYQDKRNCGTECHSVGKNKKPLQQCVGCGLVLLTMLVFRSGAISLNKPLPVRINGTVGLDVEKQPTFRKGDMWEEKCDLQGGDLYYVDAKTPSDCEDLCWEEFECFQWTHQSDTCYLKDGSGNPALEGTSTSGWRMIPAHPQWAYCYPEEVSDKLVDILKMVKEVQELEEEIRVGNITNIFHNKTILTKVVQVINYTKIGEQINADNYYEGGNVTQMQQTIQQAWDDEEDLASHYTKNTQLLEQDTKKVLERERNHADTMSHIKHGVDKLIEDQATVNYFKASELYKTCPRHPDANQLTLRECLDDVLQIDSKIGKAWARFGLIHGGLLNGQIVRESYCFQQALRYNLDITNLTFNKCPEEPRMGQDESGAYDLCELGKALARRGCKVLADSIAKALSENVPLKLKALDLRGMPFKEEELCSIVEALIKNKILQTLDLRGQAVSHKLLLAMSKGGLELEDRLLLDSAAKQLLDKAYSKPLVQIVHQGIYCGPGVGGKPDTTQAKAGSEDCSLYANGNLHKGYLEKTSGKLAAFVLNSGQMYVGGFDDRPRKGEGTMVWHNGDRYLGKWKQGNMDGLGIHIWANGNKYLGDYKEGLAEGQGTMSWPSGAMYSGSWKLDKKNGFGVYTSADGGKYIGNWKAGMRDGQGSKVWPDGAHYEGGWKNDMRNGLGTMVWPDGHSYYGAWRNDHKIRGKHTNAHNKTSSCHSQADCERPGV